MKIISVVRDFDLYNRLVKNNPYNQGVECIAFDNREENKYISVRYNEFLDAYDYSKPEWFVFCHEDWEIQEEWTKKIEKLDTQVLYGAIGWEIKTFLGMASKKLWGRIKNSEKDGGKLEIFGLWSDEPKPVSCFDCQCIIMHSSLIKEYNLRFDENLSFDLYVEDFCINAMENYGIVSKVVQLECQHYSFGSIEERFYTQLSYVEEKYKNTKRTYASTASNVLIGRKILFYAILLRGRGYEGFFYTNMYRKSGRHLIKICKIPIYWKKKKKG